MKIIIVCFLLFSIGCIDIENVETNVFADGSIVTKIFTILLKSQEGKPFTHLLNSSTITNVASLCYSFTPEEECKYVTLKNLKKSLPFVDINLKPNSKTLIIKEVYLNLLINLPAKIKQNENFFVLYEHNMNFLSKYPVLKQKFSFDCGNCNIINYPKYDKIVASKKKISFTFESSQLSQQTMFIHYAPNKPFIKFQSLYRKVLISEFNTIEFQENYVIVNHAAELEGEYSRALEDAYSNTYVVKEILFKLPLNAFGISYFDYVGNISSSEIYPDSRHIVLKIKPRFPLRNGWNTEFTIKYKIPNDEILKVEKSGLESTRTLTFPFLGIVTKDYPIEVYKLEVVFPEHSREHKVTLNSKVDYSLKFNETFYYLDVFGRPTAEIEAKNLFKDHMVKIMVSYHYNSLFMFFKPYYVSLLAFVFFMSLSGFVRLFGDKKVDQDSEMILRWITYIKELSISYLKEIENYDTNINNYAIYANKEFYKQAIDDSYDRMENELKTLKVQISDAFSQNPKDKNNDLSKFIVNSDLLVKNVNKHYETCKKLIKGNMSLVDYNKYYQNHEKENSSKVLKLKNDINRFFSE